MLGVNVKVSKEFPSRAQWRSKLDPLGPPSMGFENATASPLNAAVGAIEGEPHPKTIRQPG